MTALTRIGVAVSYTHLTEIERYQMYALRSEGFFQSEIAKELKRSPSTISREINRNKGERGWRPNQAQAKADDRLSRRGSSNVKKVSSASWNYAKENLVSEQWSPEQIAGRLALEGLETMSHETIYQRILEDKNAGGDLHTHLRCKKQRKKRYGSTKSARGSIPNRVGIEHRPASVETRNRIGHWEGDTIIGTHTKGAVIVSMVERKSRFTCLVKAKNKTTEEVIKCIKKEMQLLAKHVTTITFDNGKEFSQHDELSKSLGASIYFARPYHSWERGLNENTNGLVRQYCPKKTSFDKITDEEVQRVARKLNNRPRKCLNYYTPFEIFSKSLTDKGVALRI